MSAQPQALTQRKQQELQNQYSTYKNGLEALAQKIGDVEQEAEEHKYVLMSPNSSRIFHYYYQILLKQKPQDLTHD